MTIKHYGIINGMNTQELFDELEQLTKERNEKPNDVLLNIKVGDIYKQLGEYEYSLIFYEKAVILNPNLIGVYINMGTIYTHLKEFDKALDCYKEILKSNDNSQESIKIKAKAYLCMANICIDNNDFEVAIGLLQKSIDLNPQYPGSYMNMGNCYRGKGDIDKAIEYFNKALEIDNNYMDARFNLSELQLMQGDFKNGFKNYESRMMRQDYDIVVRHDFIKPKWQGEDIKGKTLLVTLEQGFGDSIQFSRLFYELKQMGATVLFNAFPATVELLKSNELICPEIIPLDEYKKPGFEEKIDYHIPLMSLQHILGLTRETIRFSSGYLYADPKKKEKFKTILKKDKNKFKIGIKWRGNTRVTQQRIIDVRHFLSLKDIPDVSLYSLQLDATPEELEQVPFIKNDLVEYLTDFSQTAAALANMDLLITNDTSMAHLGGATGTKTWVLLPLVSEWRWGLDVDTTPWYDSVKLFRSKDLMDWTDVFNEVKNELLANFVKI